MMRYVESINNSLHLLMSADERVFVIGEDIIDPYGGAFKATRGLSTEYPDRVLATPISEAAITGFATGMAIRGMRPIVEIMFGDFVSLCADQIINSACKFPWMYNHQVQVPLTIRTPMGGRRGYGPTHSQTIEPIFFNIPGLTIIAPSHYHNPGTLLKAVVGHSNGPVLFVENKMLYPLQLEEVDDKAMTGDFHVKIISPTDSLFPTMSLCLEKDSSPDVTLIVYGGMAPLATEAVYNLFMREEILVEVLIPSIVKPIPIDDLLPSIAKSGRVVIAEEAVRYSGWGAELGAQIQEKVSTLYKPVMRIGARECPIPCSRPLEDQVLPQVDEIENQILSILK